MTFLKRFYDNDSGATAIEYGVIIALISGVAAVGMGVLGGDLSEKWGDVSDEVAAVSTDDS